MHVDAPLLDDLLKAESGERYVPIVKRLLNVPYRPEFADFAQSLRTQWELGAIDIFVENVAESVRGLLDAPEEAKWDLIELAYTEASAIDHQRLPALRRALEEHGRLEPRNNAFTQSVQSARLRHQLTPIGWHFFQQAGWTHELSLVERSPWEDAGMISLGFFRILEVELNQRIIAPLVASLNFPELRAIPKPSNARKDESIPDNIIDKLGHVRDGRDRGLELGGSTCSCSVRRRSSSRTRTGKEFCTTPYRNSSRRRAKRHTKTGGCRKPSVRQLESSIAIRQRTAAFCRKASRRSAESTLNARC